ncbi:PaaI family thioesterase [Crenalkalicoccus roseus]|uniref:PaaI family thioesterase n=1 Tax=Crenalkalicoccus roseus TaxID=1485588 RepID=UPI00107FECB4|nr:PaaI family thioesterase [Crenalkalicoccus roseus]
MAASKAERPAMAEEGLPAGKAAEVRASFARQGLMCAIGAAITELGPGRCALELPFSEGVSQQHGFFHGGIVGALADTAGGYAALTLLPVGSEVLTLEYKINFLRPAAGRRLLAEGAVLRAGRSVLVTRVDVFVLEEGQRHACAALQQSIMRAGAAPG